MINAVPDIVYLILDFVGVEKPVEIDIGLGNTLEGTTAKWSRVCQLWRAHPKIKPIQPIDSIYTIKLCDGGMPLRSIDKILPNVKHLTIPYCLMDQIDHNMFRKVKKCSIIDVHLDCSGWGYSPRRKIQKFCNDQNRWVEDEKKNLFGPGVSFVITE